MKKQITLGRQVHYVLNQADADIINQRRATIAENGWLKVADLGSPVKAGDVFPATATRVFDQDSGRVNLQVTLDGLDTYWATDREEHEGEVAGHWHWPVISTPLPFAGTASDAARIDANLPTGTTAKESAAEHQDAVEAGETDRDKNDNAEDKANHPNPSGDSRKNLSGN